jgi:hypothetical protein
MRPSHAINIGEQSVLETVFALIPKYKLHEVGYRPSRYLTPLSAAGVMAHNAMLQIVSLALGHLSGWRLRRRSFSFSLHSSQIAE